VNIVGTVQHVSEVIQVKSSILFLVKLLSGVNILIKVWRTWVAFVPLTIPFLEV